MLSSLGIKTPLRKTPLFGDVLNDFDYYQRQFQYKMN